MKRKHVALVSGLLSLPAILHAGTIEAIEPELGRADLAMATPVYAPSDDAGITIGRFDNTFDYSRLLFDDLNVTGTKDKLQRTVKLGEVFASELELQARTMGLPIKEGGWMVEGTVRDVLVMNREIAFGPLLFYGHVTLALAVTSPEGETTSVDWMFHPTTAKYNAGFGAKDENREALAEIVVLTSQQVMARLNREFMRLSANDSTKADIDALDNPEPTHEEVRRAGLAGDPSAIDPLLGLLARSDDEHLRADVVQSLGILGAEGAIEQLKSRYAGEDEDVRYATIVALSQIGGEDDFIAQRGSRDESRAIRDLAGRVAGKHR